MREDRIAREYAEALFGEAEAKGKVEEVAVELKTVLKIIHDAEVGEFFLAPNIEAGEKKLVFNKAFLDLNRLVRNFFWLVFDNKREGLLVEIAAAYGRLVDEYRRRAVASITTAVKLPEELAGTIRLKIEETLGREVVLKREVDPGVKGGFVLRVGDRVIDVSLKNRLQELHERMISSN
ncbi:MAG: ATP synthase F1 subunit delta [Actinobacteria bacterium]|nr:ATP synthase F1 subunit delta [Actinomycetota bacterium]